MHLILAINLTPTVYYPGGFKRTRGIFGGGNPEVPSPSKTRIILDLLQLHQKEIHRILVICYQATASLEQHSPTRGCFAGGCTPTVINTIQYVTIASTGDAKDFGDLSKHTGSNGM